MNTMSRSYNVGSINETHSPDLRSWVDSANVTDCDFPIQNLPFGVFRRKEASSHEKFRIGVAIGHQIIDLPLAQQAGVFASIEHNDVVHALNQTELNALMALGHEQTSQIRLCLSRALREGSVMQSKLIHALVPQSQVEYALPAHIGDYTDFYTSIYHATSVGQLFRPDNPLLPNYKWVPIAYHGRSSSIAISGQQFRRPMGQTLAANEDKPHFGPAKRMDYEVEIGIFVGKGNALGHPITIDDAENHVFGLCLLNDWSARDIQTWEYQPLGPFLAKNFASTISPWVVTLEALAPFRQAWTRNPADPQPLAYLEASRNRDSGAFDIQLEVLIETEKMREIGAAPESLSLSNFSDSYWTISQMMTHHTVNGCNLRAGDFLGSGTQSGPLPEQAGSLLELTHGGKKPIQLKNGEQRTFMEDGDSIIMRAWCKKSAYVRIGFGEVKGQLLPAMLSQDLKKDMP